MKATSGPVLAAMMGILSGYLFFNPILQEKKYDLEQEKKRNQQTQQENAPQDKQ
ncbi:hypothetical protein TRVA0_069S00298 [Trichomonascus vanleenenianus]|uniref:uncharacterized protein n=1 Tax=Trichomonascus vanleenenianus TaxID=2268995 RepID=UPI003ECA127D